MKYPVFVYGTLMRGQRANHMLQSCEYAGEYVLADFAMYDLCRYPGIRPCRGERVLGELYYVDSQTLNAMDEYEGNGSLYHRTDVTVTRDGDTHPAQVYVYAHSTADRPLLRHRWGSNE